MFIQMSGDNFKMLCELFDGANKDLAKVDAPKIPNSFNCAAFDISYFRPKPRFRIAYDGSKGAIYIPDEVIEARRG